LIITQVFVVNVINNVQNVRVRKVNVRVVLILKIDYLSVINVCARLGSMKAQVITYANLAIFHVRNAVDLIQQNVLSAPP